MRYIKKSAIFVDLQGTLGGQGTDDIMDFQFYSFAIQAIRMINQSDYLCIVITNQSHISKGHFTYVEYEKRVLEIKKELKMNKAYIDDIFCCPHTGKDKCNCRKPSEGMITKAVKKYKIDMDKSYIIGDMGCSDMLLAYNTGAKGILVLTGVGKGSLGEYRSTWDTYEPIKISENILEAVKWIL